MSRTAELSGALTEVVAGILARGEQVLIAERVGDGPFTGLWEFPGGKLKRGESREDGLRRELREEIGVTISEFHHLVQLDHRYPDRHVRIDFFVVTGWRGEPNGRESQELRWVSRRRLPQERLLPADEPVVEALASFGSAHWA